jgi:hypothetical protein
MVIVRLNRASNFLRSTRRQLQFVTLLTAATAGTLWSSPASASRAYAYILSSYFEFGGGCPTCHNNLVGGYGTATQPFAQTLIALGLRGDDVPSFDFALTQLADSHIDSDGDTISDFDELRPKGDPNDPSVYPPDATPIPANPTPTPAPSTTSPAATPSVTPTPVTPALPTTPLPETTTPDTMAPPPTSNSGAKTKNSSCSLSPQTTTPSWAAVWGMLSIVALVHRRRASRLLTQLR